MQVSPILKYSSNSVWLWRILYSIHTHEVPIKQVAFHCKFKRDYTSKVWRCLTRSLVMLWALSAAKLQYIGYRQSSFVIFVLVVVEVHVYVYVYSNRVTSINTSDCRRVAYLKEDPSLYSLLTEQNRYTDHACVIKNSSHGQQYGVIHRALPAMFYLLHTCTLASSPGFSRAASDAHVKGCRDIKPGEACGWGACILSWM